MDVPMLRSATFVVVALCAALMGFAIQRGATCTVAAVEELVERRRPRRLIALVEASAWVAAGLLIVQRLHGPVQLPAGHALDGWTFSGAALLGLGAFVARACVFGAIARLGSGDWAHAATPLGFYLGCLSVDTLVWPHAPRALATGPALLGAPDPVVWLVAAALVARVARPTFTHRRNLPRLFTQGLWSPHAATIVIGVAFLVMLLLAGAWAYTDVLAELAHGTARSVVARALLLLCLLAGAVGGGWAAGRLRLTRVRAASVARSLAGGVMMGWGSLLIPGGNDGLILIGMPMFQPHAWAAFVTMCLCIGAAQWLQRRAG